MFIVFADMRRYVHTYVWICGEKKQDTNKNIEIFEHIKNFECIFMLLLGQLYHHRYCILYDTICTRSNFTSIVVVLNIIWLHLTPLHPALFHINLHSLVKRNYWEIYILLLGMCMLFGKQTKRILTNRNKKKVKKNDKKTKSIKIECFFSVIF